MPIDISLFLNQADAALQVFNGLGVTSDGGTASPSRDKLVEATSRMAAAIDSIAPAESRYRKLCAVTLKDHGPASAEAAEKLAGVLRALRADVEAGFLRNHEEVVRAEVFGDFLEMAEHLLSSGYKDPAATLAGGVLEEHLRKLSSRNNIPLNDGNRPKPASRLIDELSKARIINTLEQKQLITLTDLRNKAAHGKYGEYQKQDVRTMIDSIKHLVSKLPA